MSTLLLISVGNTRTRMALVLDQRLEPSRVLENTLGPGAIAQEIVELIRSTIQPGADPETTASTIVFADVHPAFASSLEAALKALTTSLSLRPEILRFGRDLPIPITHTLETIDGVGQDRLLDAIGAFERSKQACVVIDAGTAVTIDFIDGEGTFHGGAIAPGLNMMIRALNQHTAALPLIDLHKEHTLFTKRADAPAAIETADTDDDAPETPLVPAPFGKNTAQAMLVGVVASVRGLTKELIDKYAEFYEAYPRVVATGGDAPLLFEDEPLVETIVPDLTLIGMLEAIRRHEALQSSMDDDDADRSED